MKGRILFSFLILFCSFTHTALKESVVDKVTVLLNGRSKRKYEATKEEYPKYAEYLQASRKKLKEKYSQYRDFLRDPTKNSPDDIEKRREMKLELQDLVENIDQIIQKNPLEIENSSAHLPTQKAKAAALPPVADRYKQPWDPTPTKTITSSDLVQTVLSGDHTQLHEYLRHVNPTQRAKVASTETTRGSLLDLARAKGYHQVEAVLLKHGAEDTASRPALQKRAHRLPSMDNGMADLTGRTMTETHLPRVATEAHVLQQRPANVHYLPALPHQEAHKYLAVGPTDGSPPPGEHPFL